LMIIDRPEVALAHARRMVPHLWPVEAELLSGGYCNHVFRIRCDDGALEEGGKELGSVILKV